MKTETMNLKNPLVVVFTLFTFAPLGLYWMHKKTKWPKIMKNGITSGYVLIVLLTLLGFI